MSRSGYSDECVGWELIRWRGAVASATKGQRGQRFFRDLIEALGDMPVHRLIREELECDGEHCALGALGKAKGINTEGVYPEDSERIAQLFDIAGALAKEVVFENDEAGLYKETPEQRWVRVRQWAASQLKG